jgi:hypothetical protein
VDNPSKNLQGFASFNNRLDSAQDQWRDLITNISAMEPGRQIPFSEDFNSSSEYVESLLNFVTGSQLVHTLCGGVHILDFFTREPDLYESIIPKDWQEFFAQRDIGQVIDFLLRDDLSTLQHPQPPPSLLEYTKAIRKHCLDSSFRPLPPYSSPLGQQPHGNGAPRINDHVLYTGMSGKKRHEVTNFARYVAGLTDRVSDHKRRKITHIADFGSGSNYLGRTLALEPYWKNIIAIESRPHVIEGAIRMDAKAKLVQKELRYFNKKEYSKTEGRNATQQQHKVNQDREIRPPVANGSSRVWQTEGETVRATLEIPQMGRGSVQYVHHSIQDGDLSAVVHQILDRDEAPVTEDPARPSIDAYEVDDDASRISKDLSHTHLSSDPAVMVISLHSCGNLLHHGLRTITMNPSVKAVAMIGCCYNLLTERLGAGTHKISNFYRLPNRRLETTSAAEDPHGFPMSRRFLEHRHPVPNPHEYSKTDSNLERSRTDSNGYMPDGDDIETGIRLNITARMMAVQAPHNWTKEDSSNFFKRHFYRAALQRILLDRGVVTAPQDIGEVAGRSPAGTGSSSAISEPIIIGNLAKRCYANFVAYVRGAVDKIQSPELNQEAAKLVLERVGAMTDEEILAYEERYQPRKLDLSVVWTLMSFSSQVIEAMIIVDRWLWLTEQECIETAWVETVFDYRQSPRNMVVVGIKK